MRVLLFFGVDKKSTMFDEKNIRDSTEAAAQCSRQFLVWVVKHDF